MKMKDKTSKREKRKTLRDNDIARKKDAKKEREKKQEYRPRVDGIIKCKK